MTCLALYMGLGYTVFACGYADNHDGLHSWEKPVELCNTVSPDGRGLCMLPTSMSHDHDWQAEAEAEAR